MPHIRFCLFALIVALPAALSQPDRKEEPVGLANLDFEDGTKGWGVWYSDDPKYPGPKFEWVIDKEVVAKGKASLRIVATDRRALVFVNQSTKQFTKGTRYELSYWVRFSDPTQAEMYENCAVTVNLVKPKADGKGRDMTQVNPVTFYKRGENGWIHRTGFFTVAKDMEELQLGLSVRRTLGTVWFDDIKLRPVPAGEIIGDSMFDYAPGQVEHGDAMVKRFETVRDKRAEILGSADTFNDKLVVGAELSDKLNELRRGAFYLDAHGKTVSIKPAEDAVGAFEKEVDKLYRAYAKAFKNPRQDNLLGFRELRVELMKPYVQANVHIIDATRALLNARRPLAFKPRLVLDTEKQEQEIAPNGKPNQIVFGTVSLQSHYELEKPLGVNSLYASSIFEAKGSGPGKYDFSGTLNSWNFYKKLGVQRSSIGTALAVHTNQMAPTWFLDKFKADDDIMMMGHDGKKAHRPEWSMGAPLNTWRPEVREMTADFISQMGKTFRDQPQYLFYVVAPENGGPYFIAENGVRSIGYNKSALPDFHAWLKKRYGSIEELNKQWKTEHKSFDAIALPPDLLAVDEWQRPHPAAYEFAAWRNDHHHHWLKLLYDEFKKADPTKPVMADHSALLAQIDGSRIFDTADIISVHHHPQVTPTLATNYVYSMNRFAKKHLALYENGWGCAEAMPHHASEVEQRAALTKYLYRLTAWGAHTQMWWYAYTQNDYMIRFNGNWFNPVHDLTTLRYSAAGLPVAKDRVKRLESVFLNSAIQRSRVVLLQPVTSMLFQNYWKESYTEMERMHDLLYARNDHHEVLPETFFTDGRAKLDDYDVVILPYAQFLPDGFADKLRDWTKRGGTLIALGPFGLYDKFGFDSSAFWQEVFGKELPARFTKPFKSWDQTREFRWGWDEKKDEAPILDKEYGKGRVVVSLRGLRSLAMQGKPSADLVAAVEAKVRRAASSPSNQFEFTIHETADGKQYLCAINTATDKPVSDTVTLAGEYKSGVDVAIPGGFPVLFKAEKGSTTFSLRLEPGEMTLIELRK